MQGTLSLNKRKLREAISVKVDFSGLKPVKARLWIAVRLISLARAVAGCQVEAVCHFDNEKAGQALDVRW